MINEKFGSLLFMIRSAWFIVVVIFLYMGCSGRGLSESVNDDSVVAVINESDITVKELRIEIKQLMRQFRVKNLKEITKEEKILLKTNALNRIIQGLLLKKEAKSNRIFISRNEYRDAFQNVTNGYQENTFSEYLKVEGVSPEAWNKKFRNNILIKKLIREVVNKKIIVREDEIKKYYASHHLEFQKEEQVRALHIMTETESEIKYILKQLKSDKKKFSYLAQMHSLGPEGPAGGDLGYFEMGQMPEEFDGVFSLGMGQISDTIKTPYGYHIFMLIDKKPASQMTFDDSRKNIYNILLRKYESKVFKTFITNLKKNLK